MPKINEEAFDQASKGAALQSSGEEKKKPELQRQTIVYDIPKAWLEIIKDEGMMSQTAFIRVAIKEKLERDGLI